jgi:DNA-binding transcriptional regulator YiaG
MYFKAYLKLSAILLDIMRKSKEISQDLRKNQLQTSTSLVHPWEQFLNA